MESEWLNLTNNAFVAIISAGAAGIFSTIGTVKALGIHISYIKLRLQDIEKQNNHDHEKLDAAIMRAHIRIDQLIDEVNLVKQENAKYIAKNIN
jgi:hypothetical protein